MLAAVALLANLFVAPASFFQNDYLEDARGYSATLIAVFTVVTATPAGVGLIIGGRIADIRGRKRVIAVGLPTATALVVLSFSVGGPVMWLSVFVAGVLSGITFPALAVYRTELFPTGNRGRAVGLLTTTALLGGITGCWSWAASSTVTGRTDGFSGCWRWARWPSWRSSCCGTRRPPTVSWRT